MRRHLGTLVAGLLLLSSASSVRADEAGPTATGWWWVAQQAPAEGLAVPPPATVPQGGLYVASDPSQTQAISALRYTLAEGATPGSLTLGIADVKGIGEVGACLATGQWAPAEAGEWTARPSFTCSAAAVGAVGADGTTITFDLTKLSLQSVVDVVLVPLRDAAGNSPALQMAFDPPGPSSLSYQPTASTDTGLDDPGADPSSAAPQETEPSEASTFEVSPPAVPSPGASPPSPLSNPVDASQSRSAPRTAPVAAAPIAGYSFGESTRFQLIAALLAMNLAAAAAWSKSRPHRTPRLLGIHRAGPEVAGHNEQRVAPDGAVAAVPVRGLGRYRAPRPAGERRRV